jgi:DNA-binding transcriptional LysR family regulator
MLNLDVDLLRAFVAVADTGGFTSAARQLHRTQSAVSMQVKRIEEMVGKRVFDRSGRSVRLTANGEILLSHARRMLKINEEAIADLVSPEIEGVVRLGIPDGYGTYYLPRILTSFSRAYPRVQLEIRSEMTGQLADSLNAGDLDLGLLVRDPSHPGGEMLWAEPINWVGSKESPIHEENPLPLSLFGQGCRLRADALNSLDDVDRRWRIVYCSPSLAAVQAAVLAGLGITVLGASTVLPGMRTLGHAEGFPTLSPSVIELHRSQTQSSPAVERLAQHITDKLRGWKDAPTSNQSQTFGITSDLSRAS